MKTAIIPDNEEPDNKYFKEGPGFYKAEMGGEFHLAIVQVANNDKDVVWPFFVCPWSNLDEETKALLESQNKEEEIQESKKPEGYVSENFALKMAALIKAKNVNICDIDI